MPGLSVMARLGLDGRAFEQGLRKAGIDANRFGSQIGTALAGSFSVAFVQRAVRDTVKFSAAMKSAAEQAGISNKEMQQMSFAAKTVGVTSSELAQAFKGLANARKQALMEGEGGRKLSFFERLGISLDELRGADNPAELFRRVAAGLKQVRNELDKSAIASEFFEETGVRLIPLFNANLEKTVELFDKLDLALGDETLDSLDKLNAAFMTMDAIIAKSLAPAIASLMDDLEKVAYLANKIPGFSRLTNGGLTAGMLAQLPAAAISNIPGIGGPLSVLRAVAGGGRAVDRLRGVGAGGAGAGKAGHTMHIGLLKGSLSMLGFEMLLPEVLAAAQKDAAKKPGALASFMPPTDSLARIGGFTGRGAASRENMTRKIVSATQQTAKNTARIKDKLEF